jgi:hypothetical protein
MSRSPSRSSSKSKQSQHQDQGQRKINITVCVTAKNTVVEDASSVVVSVVLTNHVDFGASRGCGGGKWGVGGDFASFSSV